jgi:magnesium transporter
MLMGAGGNCGAQASTLTIRGLALGEIATRDIYKLLWKEARVGTIVGAALSLLNLALYTFLYKQPLNVAATISAALFLTVLLSKALGCALPLAAKSVKLDPALMASPLITTIVDACSLLILFTIATNVLHL